MNLPPCQALLASSDEILRELTLLFLYVPSGHFKPNSVFHKVLHEKRNKYFKPIKVDMYNIGSLHNFTAMKFLMFSCVGK